MERRRIWLIVGACAWVAACGGNSASSPGGAGGGLATAFGGAPAGGRGGGAGPGGIGGAAASPGGGAGAAAGGSAGVGGSAGATGSCSIPAAAAATFFPYQVGARWMFEGHGSTSLSSLDTTFVQERTITGTKAFGADTALVLWNSNPDESSVGALEEYVRLSAQGLVNYGTNAQAKLTGIDLPLPLPSYTEVPFPVDACGAFVAFDVPLQNVAYDFDGDGTYDMAGVHADTAIRMEDVTVPVGAFPGALRVERTIVTTVVGSQSKVASQIAQTQVDWYASGVGPIKRTTNQSGRMYEFDLIAYSLSGVSHGFMPPTVLARGLSQPLGAVEDGEASAAIGFDGTNFLAVAPIGSITYSSSGGGGLQSYVIAPDGTTMGSAPLLDASESVGFPVIAFDGTRYLVAYVNAGYARVEVVIVSPAGETLDGPIVLSKDPAPAYPNLPTIYPDSGGAPSVVATKAGFLVGYSKGTQINTSTSIANLWLAPVDATGHATDRVVPFPDSAQGPAVLATDGTTVLAVWTEASGQNIAIRGARFDGTGHPLDAAPFLISSAQPNRINSLQVIFDGTQFVALWALSGNSSWTARVARVALDGTLRDGPASAGGVSVGIPTGTRPGPSLGRLGRGSVIVWAWDVVSDFRYGIAATRYTVDGELLDMSTGTGGLIVEGALAAMPFPEYPHPSIAWGADRALMVWSADIGTDTSGYDVAPVFPW